MHDWVSFDHQVIKNSDARIPAVSNAALFGKGVFTTIRIHEGLPFLFDKHWQRLEHNAGRLDIALFGLRKELLLTSLIELIDKNGFDNGRCRVTLFDGSSQGIWHHAGGSVKSSVLIQTADLRTSKTGISLGVSTFPVTSNSPLNNIKSCNYLDRLHGLETAAASGFDEAVRLNEKGEVVSACLANLFWIKDGRIFTPSVDTGCLEGTTRAFVLEHCGVSVVRAHIDVLSTAQSVFLTSAGLGIGMVKEIVFESATVRFAALEEDFFVENDLTKLMF